MTPLRAAITPLIRWLNIFHTSNALAEAYWH